MALCSFVRAVSQATDSANLPQLMSFSSRTIFTTGASFLQPCTFIQGSQKCIGINADPLREFEKLKDIESPFTAFNFGHKRLRARQPIRQLSLSEGGFFSGRYEKLAKPFMLLRKYRFGHSI
jgi:hypothetical protein